MTQNPDTQNEYNACVAVDGFVFEECNIPEAQDTCSEDEFHCELNKVT